MKCRVPDGDGTCERDTGTMLMCLAHWTSVPPPERRTLTATMAQAPHNEAALLEFQRLFAAACQTAATNAESTKIATFDRFAASRKKSAKMKESNRKAAKP